MGTRKWAAAAAANALCIMVVKRGWRIFHKAPFFFFPLCYLIAQNISSLFFLTFFYYLEKSIRLHGPTAASSKSSPLLFFSRRFTPDNLFRETEDNALVLYRSPALAILQLSVKRVKGENFQEMFFKS